MSTATSTAFPDFVPVRAAAKYLGCSIATVNRRIDSGVLEVVDISGPGAKCPMRRIRRESLEALLRPVEPPSEPFVSTMAELFAAAPKLTDEQASRIAEIRIIGQNVLLAGFSPSCFSMVLSGGARTRQ